MQGESKQPGEQPPTVDMQPADALALAKVLVQSIADIASRQNLKLREELLDELWLLARMHPQDIRVREQLARGIRCMLNSTLLFAHPMRGYELLDDLRLLVRVAPLDAAIATALAEGLKEIFWYVRSSDDSTKRQNLLHEMWSLAARFPDNGPVRLAFAQCLYPPTFYADDKWLADLRALALAHPDDEPLQREMISRLHVSIHIASKKNDQKSRDDLFGELRSLSRRFPEPGLQHLARALADCIEFCASRRQKPMTEWLDELRSLQARHPEEPMIRICLAQGLHSDFMDAVLNGDLQRRNALLIELRLLAATYPDFSTCHGLAEALLQMLFASMRENDLRRRDDFLEEMRSWAAKLPAFAPFCQKLAHGLCNTLHSAKNEKDLTRRDNLLDELRSLARIHPTDDSVRQNLAMGLFAALNDAREQNDLKRRDNLLDQLRSLIAQNPKHISIYEWLAKGLYNTYKNEEDQSRRDDLFNELQALAATDRSVDFTINQQLLGKDKKSQDDPSS